MCDDRGKQLAARRYSQAAPMRTERLKLPSGVFLTILVILSRAMAFGSDQQKAEKRLP